MDRVLRGVILRRIGDDRATWAHYSQASEWPTPSMHAAFLSNRGWARLEESCARLRSGEAAGLDPKIDDDLVAAAGRGEGMAALNRAAARLFVHDVVAARECLEGWSRLVGPRPPQERRTAASLRGELAARSGDWPTAARQFEEAIGIAVPRVGVGDGPTESAVAPAVDPILCFHSGVAHAAAGDHVRSRVRLREAFEAFDDARLPEPELSARRRRVLELRDRAALHWAWSSLHNGPGDRASTIAVVHNTVDPSTWHGLLSLALVGDRSIVRAIRSIPDTIQGPRRDEMMTQAKLAAARLALLGGDRETARLEVGSLPPMVPGMDYLDHALGATLSASLRNGAPGGVR